MKEIWLAKIVQFGNSSNSSYSPKVVHHLRSLSVETDERTVPIMIPDENLLSWGLPKLFLDSSFIWCNLKANRNRAKTVLASLLSHQSQKNSRCQEYCHGQFDHNFAHNQIPFLMLKPTDPK